MPRCDLAYGRGGCTHTRGYAVPQPPPRRRDEDAALRCGRSCCCAAAHAALRPCRLRRAAIAAKGRNGLRSVAKGCALLQQIALRCNRVRCAATTGSAAVCGTRCTATIGGCAALQSLQQVATGGCPLQRPARRCIRLQRLRYRKGCAAVCGTRRTVADAAALRGSRRSSLQPGGGLLQTGGGLLQTGGGLLQTGCGLSQTGGAALQQIARVCITWSRAICNRFGCATAGYTALQQVLQRVAPLQFAATRGATTWSATESFAVASCDALLQPTALWRSSAALSN